MKARVKYYIRFGHIHYFISNTFCFSGHLYLDLSYQDLSNQDLSYPSYKDLSKMDLCLQDLS